MHTCHLPEILPGKTWLLPACLAALLVLAACSDEQTTAPPATDTEAPAQTVESQPATTETEPATAETTADTVTFVSESAGYEIQCDADGRNCKVDAETFVGWRMYSTNCLACHGPDAKGSSMAPNLMDRLNANVDYDRFVYVMTNGYTGRMGAMPTFNKNAAVMGRLPSIYQYLRARADGALGEGRPERIQ